ncbi:hypothetical protein E1301_Tti008711 [Triplophysa tibetana]|uniref:Uncharacterized protein n=1 Tax=Triplophysa tibetana TaxID=1572043 RepID=A0A5A9PP50_9TELE|nr:hypothetical protein E1301_Tti008711 [Triplophysa tibetana]
MSIVEEDFDENVFNDPMNSVMGGALKHSQSIDGLPIMGIDETVHDLPTHEDSPDATSPHAQDPLFPAPQLVLCKDDIIGARASIVYDNCLRQLATFLILPAEKCKFLLRTGLPCNSVAPFEINIAYRGTATSIEWVCPNGHSLWRWNSQPVVKFGMQAGDFLLSTNILLSGNNYGKVALLFKFMNMGMVNTNTFFSIQDTYCVDTIKDFWEQRRNESVSQLQGKDVIVLDPDKGKYKALEIHHSLDMWHGAKNLAKKIAAAAKIKGQSILLVERYCEPFLVVLQDSRHVSGLCFKRLYKKNARRYSVYALKSEKTYGYISELQGQILNNRLTCEAGISLQLPQVHHGNPGIPAKGEPPCLRLCIIKASKIRPGCLSNSGRAFDANTENNAAQRRVTEDAEMMRVDWTVFEKIEEVVLAAQGLTEVTSAIQELSDIVHQNRKTTLALTEEQSRNVRAAFTCLVCRENLAFKGTATQSSTYDTWTAQRAIDGVQNGGDPHTVPFCSSTFNESLLMIRYCHVPQYDMRTSNSSTREI